jgi:hypothetical protein
VIWVPLTGVWYVDVDISRRDRLDGRSQPRKSRVKERGRWQKTSGDGRIHQETAEDIRRRQKTSGDGRRHQETAEDLRRLQKTSEDVSFRGQLLGPEGA